MKPRRTKIIAEREQQGAQSLLAMWPNGEVRRYASPAKLVDSVKRRDRWFAARGESTVTVIEWRDGLRPLGKLP